MRCGEGERWPWASTLSPFQFEAFPRFAIAKGDRNNHAFNFAAVACSGRDLVEEYLTCGVWPLGRDWTVGPVARRHFAGFVRYITELGNGRAGSS